MGLIFAEDARKITEKYEKEAKWRREAINKIGEAVNSAAKGGNTEAIIKFGSDIPMEWFDPIIEEVKRFGYRYRLDPSKPCPIGHSPNEWYSWNVLAISWNKEEK